MNTTVPKYPRQDSKSFGKALTAKVNTGYMPTHYHNHHRPLKTLTEEIIKEMELEFAQGVGIYYRPYEIVNCKVTLWECGSFVHNSPLPIGYTKNTPEIQGIRWKLMKHDRLGTIHYGVTEQEYKE